MNDKVNRLRALEQKGTLTAAESCEWLDLAYEYPLYELSEDTLVGDMWPEYCNDCYRFLELQKVPFPSDTERAELAFLEEAIQDFEYWMRRAAANKINMQKHLGSRA